MLAAIIKKNIAKTKLISFLFILSVIMLHCADYNPYVPTSEKSLDQTIKHLLDENASCSIPKSAQVIHLPQIHKYPEQLRGDWPEQFVDFFHDIAAHSQFLISHIIRKNPSHVVFDEASRFIITKQNKDAMMYTITNTNGIKRNLNLQDVADIFNHQLPASYNKLDRNQRNLLVELGAASVALSLDHINIIHRTHNTSEAELIVQIVTKMWDTEKELELEFHDLYERISTAQKTKDEQALKELQKEAKKLSEKKWSLLSSKTQLILDKREEILAREVNFFLENNPSKKVFIIYGAAHDLSDEFSGNSFHTLPHACTMPESFLKNLAYARYLKSWADRIYNDNDILFPAHIQSMRILYRKSHSILMDTIEGHINKGGSKKDPSMNWNIELNRYLTYSELELIAESIYVQMVALEDLIRSSQFTSSTTKN